MAQAGPGAGNRPEVFVEDVFAEVRHETNVPTPELSTYSSPVTGQDELSPAFLQQRVESGVQLLGLAAKGKAARDSDDNPAGFQVLCVHSH